MAEFLAMILFIVISIGSALGCQYPMENNQTSGAPQDNVKVSLAFGLSIATLAQSVGHISGAHLNPAVTLGLLLSCQISILRALMYIVAQCVGAIVATAILSGITSNLPGNSLGRNDVSGAGDWRVGGLEGWRVTCPPISSFPWLCRLGPQEQHGVLGLSQSSELCLARAQVGRVSGMAASSPCSKGTLAWA